MKRILAIALALFCATSFGATLNPIQLLNPAGSTSGQAIVSTGPTSAPTWAAITPAAIGGLTAANNLSDVASATAALTNLGGLSATTAAATYLTQANAASTYATITNLALKAAISGTTFTGASGLSYSNATFTLNDTSASNKAQVLFQKNGTSAWALSNSSTANTLAIDRFVSGSYVDSPIQVSNSTGVVTITNALSVSQTAGIVGTTTTNNANAGSVGEILTNTASGVSMPTGTQTNVVALALTAGDWEVSGNILFTPTGQLTVIQAGCNSTSATLNNNEKQVQQTSFLNGAVQQLAAPVTRISLASSATVYLVGAATFTTGTVSGGGFIRARRVR